MRIYRHEQLNQFKQLQYSTNQLKSLLQKTTRRKQIQFVPGTDVPKATKAIALTESLR